MPLLPLLIGDAPADEEAPSAQLLIRGAFIRKLMSGVYTLLPLGWRVLRKVERIVRVHR